MGSSPEGIAFDGTNTWVANFGSDSVTELSLGGAVLGTTTVGGGPYGVSSDVTHVWVTNYTDGTVSEISIVTPKPTIVSFTPASGAVGKIVTIKGTNLNGATKILFGTVRATKVKSDFAKQIDVYVPNGAKTGRISVVTAGGTAKSATSFKVT